LIAQFVQLFVPVPLTTRDVLHNSLFFTTVRLLRFLLSAQVRVLTCWGVQYSIGLAKLALSKSVKKLALNGASGTATAHKPHQGSCL